jgi:hypothetical protein
MTLAPERLATYHNAVEIFMLSRTPRNELFNSNMRYRENMKHFVLCAFLAATIYAFSGASSTSTAVP